MFTIRYPRTPLVHNYADVTVCETGRRGSENHYYLLNNTNKQAVYTIFSCISFVIPHFFVFLHQTINVCV